MSQLDFADHRIVSAYRAGYEESVRTDSEPSKCECPYAAGSAEAQAFNLGWNSHYDERWDR